MKSDDKPWGTVPFVQKKKQSHPFNRGFCGGHKLYLFWDKLKSANVAKPSMTWVCVCVCVDPLHGNFNL